MINTQFVTNENVPFDKAHNNEIVYKSLKNKNIIRNTVVGILYHKDYILEYISFETDGSIREKPFGRLENGHIDINGTISLVWKDKPIDHYLLVSYEYIVRKNVPLLV